MIKLTLDKYLDNKLQKMVNIKKLWNISKTNFITEIADFQHI